MSLDSTVSSGTEYAVSYTVVLMNGEVDAIQSVGGGAGPMASGSGGFIAGLVGFVTSIPGMIITTLGGIAGLSWFRGGS